MKEIKTYKPITPSLRQKRTIIFPISSLGNLNQSEQRTKGFSVKEYKKLLQEGKRTSINGRNNQGKITIRHRGGGHKRKLRFIDYNRNWGQYAIYTVENIEYNPNGSGFIALCYNKLARRNCNKYKYILANSELKIGTILRGPLSSKITSANHIGENEKNKLGGGIKQESQKLKEIPVGTNIFNISLKAGDKGKLTRAAGTTSTLLNKKNQECIIRLPSNKIISLNENCLASTGRVSNINHSLIVKGKAGTNRWLGIRPTVRGEAMNPVDHPHGGKSHGSGGVGNPMHTKWGKLAKWTPKKMSILKSKISLRDHHIMT